MCIRSRLIEQAPTAHRDEVKTLYALQAIAKHHNIERYIIMDLSGLHSSAIKFDYAINSTNT